MTQQVKQAVKIKPISNRVVVKRLEQEETLKGGIIIPDSAKKKQESAQVIAVGSGKVAEDGNLISMPVSVGDVVLIDKYAGQEVTFNDEELVIVRADDIIAIIEQ